MNGDLSVPKPRERILETASNLFYNYGYRAIGIDRIIADSGVAKMTFYKHFPSKDDLIAEYLHTATEQFSSWINTVIEGQKTPRKQLEAIFDGIAKIASSAHCMGCAFSHAAAEFPDVAHPGHAAALEYKNGVLAKLEELAKAMKAKDSQGLAQDLMMVMDGAWAAARMYGAGNHASRAGKTARVLIAAQVK